MFGRLIITIASCAIVAQSKPIMVSFGTKGGPIVPPTPSTTTVNPLAPKNPAPVYEQVDDIPPPVYRAPTPNQYRNVINSFKPDVNLQLGTPLDIKYQELNTLSQLQVQQQKADYAQQQGLAYNGGQVFTVQAYEYDNARNGQQNQQSDGRTGPTSAQQFVQQYIPKKQNQKNQVQATGVPVKEEGVGKQNVRPQRHQDQAVQSTRYTSVYSVREPQQQQQQQQQPQFNYHYNYNNQNKQQHQQLEQIPAFGVAFSSGLRYYVPQYYYYDSRHQQQQQQKQQFTNNYHKSQQRYNDVNDNAIYGH